MQYFEFKPDECKILHSFERVDVYLKAEHLTHISLKKNSKQDFSIDFSITLCMHFSLLFVSTSLF